MRDPVRRLGDGVSRRIAHEVRAGLESSPPVVPEASTREQYLSIAALRDRQPRPGEALTSSELRVFSQNGEDGVLAEIFGRLATERGSFVEIGVEDGVECNTRYLAEVLGWSGVYVEADDACFQSLSARLANRADLVTVHQMVTPENVEQLFADAGVPTDLDLLSIDVDGQDYWIWEAIEAYTPRVVVVEYNAGLPADRLLVEPRGRSGWTPLSDFFGASIGAFRALGEQKGYTLVHTELAGVNAFFVRNEFAAGFAGEPLLRGPNYDLRGRHHVDVGGDDEYVEVDPG
jgi:hypothetical protein